MQQIGDWLEQLGLGQYAVRFVENGIETDVLRDLTDDDLAALGVLLGHRRRMLRAIRDLPEIPSRPAEQVEHGERRQITVMFADLVGSTALASRLDPEDMRHVISAYQDCCATVVARYDGSVAQFLGDGVMVCFGYPRAHGDDAERAARAALDIIDAVDRLAVPKASNLRAHVGIATGIVVVGDIQGDTPRRGAAREWAVVGETPNLASRLLAAAAAGEVVVSSTTRRLLGDVFTIHPGRALMLKGLEAPVESWIVRAVIPATSRFEAVHPGRLTTFVGRGPEVALLEQQRARAFGIGQDCQGQVVIISGEAGIGKSRFIAEFADRISGEKTTRLRYQCSPYHTASTLHPVIEQLRGTAGIAGDDDTDVKLDKLQTLLSATSPVADDAVALLAALLSIPSSPRFPPPAYDGVRRRRQTLATLLDQLEALARRQPVLILFEDIHWGDPTTLELLNLMIERIRGLPVLALVTHRPEFAPPWIGLGSVTSITLERLGVENVRAMIRWIAAATKVPDTLIAHIHSKTDGVPLFVEELTKAVLESSLLVEEPDGYRLDGPLPPLAIPFTLQDSLMARLDRLAPVREVAQVGAVIGREFSFALLAAVANRDHATLAAALERLEAAELLFRTGMPPHDRYRFKHALVRDAAYESLLHSRRQVLHRRVASVLRGPLPTVASAEPELIAHHLAQAGLAVEAVEWWGKAGEQAAARSAYQEAIAHYREATALAETLVEADRDRSLMIRLYIAYGDALSSGLSPGAPATRQAYARARALASEITIGAERYPVFHGLWTSSVIRADTTSMRDLAAMFRIEASRTPGTPEAGLARRFVGVLGWMVGDFPEGRANLEAAVRAYEEAPSHDFGFQLDLHPGVAAMLQLALVDGLQGRDRAARALSERGRALAVATAHTSTMLYAHTWGGTLYAMLEDPAATLASARVMSRMGQEHDLPFWQVLARFFEDWARWLAGDRAVAMDGMRQSLEFVQDHGLKWYSILLPVLMAAPEAAIGDGKDAGLALVDQALEEITATGLMWLRPEALRHRAAILAQGCGADLDAAALTYLEALHTARFQSFHRSALRAIIGLANLRGDLPDRDIVEDVLRSCPVDADMAELGLVKRGRWSERWDPNPRLSD